MVLYDFVVAGLIWIYLEQTRTSDKLGEVSWEVLRT